jgi:hypothetical protein
MQRCIFQCMCAPPLVNANRQQLSSFRRIKKRKCGDNLNGPIVPWIYLWFVYQLNLRVYSQPHLDRTLCHWLRLFFCVQCRHICICISCTGRLPQTLSTLAVYQWRSYDYVLVLSYHETLLCSTFFVCRC